MAVFDGVCEIRRAGINQNGLAQLDLRDTATSPRFDWRWFFSPDNLTREMLAIALAAIASDKRVAVFLADIPDSPTPIPPDTRVTNLLIIK